MQYVLRDELRAFGVTVKHLMNGGWTLFEMYAAGHLIPVTVEYDGTPERSRKGGGKRMVYRGTTGVFGNGGIEVFDLVDDCTEKYGVECKVKLDLGIANGKAYTAEFINKDFVRLTVGGSELIMGRKLYDLHWSNGTLTAYIDGALSGKDNIVSYRGTNTIPTLDGNITYSTIDSDPLEDCPLCTGSGHREDSIVSDITTQLIDRAVHGEKKYGVTLDRTDLTPQQWAQHALEEMLDGAGYLASLIRDLDKHRPLKPVPSHAELLAMAPGEYSDWEKRIWARGFKACVTAFIRK